MKGDYVVVRTFGGGAALAQVWDETPDAVVVLSPQEYGLQLSGGGSLFPIGFKHQDVFKHDVSLNDMLATGVIEWQRLAPYPQNL